MLNISNFLQRFLSLEKDNKTKLSLISLAVKTISGIEISHEMIQIQGENLRLKCNPVFRNEIFMRKSQIEDSLKSQKIFLNIM